MNLVEFLRSKTISDLKLSEQLRNKLYDLQFINLQKLYAAVLAARALNTNHIDGLSSEEFQAVNEAISVEMVAYGLKKPAPVPAREPAPRPVARPAPAARASRLAKPQVAARVSPQIEQQVETQTYPANSPLRAVVPGPVVPQVAPQARPQPRPQSAPKAAAKRVTQVPAIPPSPLAEWEARLAPQLRRVELVGEIEISRQELDDISAHFSRLFYNRSQETVLSEIKRYYPATFLVFMVGQGIYGYNMGDFWPAYEAALRCSIDHGAFGRLFEKLLHQFDKPLFKDLQEKSLRYVSLVLAHGGIPVYCLKDFFNNIVLVSLLRPQLSALSGEELVEEMLKHTTYTVNTDKPILYFLEYGGRAAADLLDRSRKLLLTWQQTQTLLSAEAAGLPAHLTQYFAGWARENAALAIERGPRSRLKRPQLSLDPWGLGVFLTLPAQPISALKLDDLRWTVEAGDYREEIKVRTRRRGEQVETREVTLRLSKVPENILVQFAQGDSHYEWKIKGYTPDHLILAFDPVSGQVQNHIVARETWLLYPRHFRLAVLEGSGALLEVLPELPGEWSQFRLECWDLTAAVRLGLAQNEQTFRELYIRGQDKLPQPYLEGGRLVPTDLEENPVPCYTGVPPEVRIPITRAEGIQAELSRWQIQVKNLGPADPEISVQSTLADLPEQACAVTDSVAAVRLDSAQFLTSRPAGTYQISIKGPLGRDATLTLQILPECHLAGLKDLYIPDPKRGSENVTFTLQTTLSDSVDSSGADGVRVEELKTGLHRVTVPAEVSSVGLLVRRETLKQQWIRVPLQLRLKRLRWRQVTGSGLAENWLQKYTTQSVQELLQEESPLLVVELPGNETGEISLHLNVLDLRGAVIQQCKPAERSSRRASRFWRFDLAQIKHVLEVNDSPIFRIDLVGTRDNNEHEAFYLPVLLLTSQLNIAQLRGDPYSSFNYHHLLVTWQEKKQIRSRALVIWSLFRPWQTPIIENIPDSAVGEYEFELARKDIADGIYRMQMIVVDPWAAAAPPLFPPPSGSAGCAEVKFSSPQDRLKTLERELLSAPTRQSTQISSRIELALIRQHLGQVEESYRDLEMCCRSLLPAGSREILTLRSILVDLNAAPLTSAFGEQIITSAVLNRLFEDLAEGAITVDEIISILRLAPPPKSWPAQACEVLVQLEDPEIRVQALAQLIAKDTEKGIAWITKLMEQSRISVEDAVELLYEEKPSAIEYLKKLQKDIHAEQLLDLLTRYNPYSGLPVVKIGSWVLSNAGWGRIDEILDPRTRLSVDSFLEGAGSYLLSVTLHIYETYDLSGEKAMINMQTSEITFSRASRVFICPDCREFATAKLDMFKNHMLAAHGRAYIYPGERKNVVPLTRIEFNQNPL